MVLHIQNVDSGLLIGVDQMSTKDGTADHRWRLVAVRPMPARVGQG